ncbi:hypothetical protein B296_00053121 [Ensete ventricosum]|uniref:Uncharacterized protein n=1 Tax=Ensete ventricosum TaxID=4639 RepID=A0A426WWV4_ENSVE|nr:hypothetical protein B296_00053121 [Ensete ventricosum]
MVCCMSMVSRKNVTVINFALSRVSIGFSCTVSKIQNTGLSRLFSPWEVVQARFPRKIQRSLTLHLVEFRSVFHALSQKFKILAIHNVLARGKSYEHGFTKKHDGHKLYAESSFDRFFVHRLENSKYWSFPSY